MENNEQNEQKQKKNEFEKNDQLCEPLSSLSTH